MCECLTERVCVCAWSMCYIMLWGPTSVFITGTYRDLSSLWRQKAKMCLQRQKKTHSVVDLQDLKKERRLGMNTKQQEATFSLNLSAVCGSLMHVHRGRSKESLDITREPITHGDNLGSKVAGSRGPIVILP